MFSLCLIILFCGVTPQDTLNDLQEYFYPDNTFSQSGFFQHVNQIQKIVRSGDLEATLNEFEQLNNSPHFTDDARAYLLLEQSSCLIQLKQHKAAIQYLRDVASFYSQDEEVQVICNAAIGLAMIETLSNGDSYKASAQSICDHYDRFLNATDSFHPHVIWAHLHYAGFLMWPGQGNGNTEYKNLAFEHLDCASLLISTALEQLNPRKIKPYSRFKHYMDLLKYAGARIKGRFRMYSYHESDTIININNDVIVLYEHLNNGFIGYNADYAQRFLDDHPTMDIIPLLIEILNDDSSNSEKIFRALGMLTFADPSQAEEILLDTIDSFMNSPERILDKGQDYILYGAIYWLGYTGNNELLPLLEKMKEPEYWINLGIYRKGFEPPYSPYDYSVTALYSVARMGAPESEALIEKPGFIPASSEKHHGATLREIVKVRKAGHLVSWPKSGSEKYRVDGCVITPLPTPRELFIKRVIIIVAILVFLTLCLVVGIFIRSKRKNVK